MTTLRPAILVAAGASALAVAARRRTGAMTTADLNGRTAAVTGGGSGIGRAIALLLGSRGATVHVVDVDEERATAVAGEIGPRGIAHAVDVSDADAMLELASALQKDGPVDLLFNNAGFALAGDTVEMTLDDWNRQLDVNVRGVIHGVHAFLPGMIEAGRPAVIVNTSSMAGLLPAAGSASYSMTKGAVLALSLALDQEVRSRGIRVHALCPGIVATDILRAGQWRGAYTDRADPLVRLYDDMGTSPDVVARQTLAAVERGQTIIASPRSQVLPPWLLTRLAPQAGTRVWSLLVDVLTNRALKRYGYAPSPGRVS